MGLPRAWLARALVRAALLYPLVCAGSEEQECCWCGKPYIRDRSAQTAALASLTNEGEPLLGQHGTKGSGASMVIRGMLGPVDVRPDRGFYVEGVDADASLVIVVLHPPADRLLVVTLALDGDKLPDENEKFKGEHYEKIRWEVQLPSDGAHTHWLKLPLKLRAGLRTLVHWTLADWPLLRHTGGGKILSKGSVAITVAESLAVAQGIGAVRVVHLPNRTAHLEAFRSDADTPQPIFPYGFFANWGGWMGKDLSGSAVSANVTIGNVVHPVSPFDPGGLDAVETFLDVAAKDGIKWEHDMRHITADTADIVTQIERFKTSPAILSWYISDEPDGAGDHVGPPVGISPAQVRAAYDAAKAADPYHPISLSLNCMESAQYYAGAADIIMVDTYPIGISAEGCAKRFGCCGCDDCDGHVDDVAYRVRHVGRELLGGSRPIGSILQAFGGEHHWLRGPTAVEFRAMSYLGLVYGAHAGMTYWLREEGTDPALIDEAKRLGTELEGLAPIVLSGLPLTNKEDDAVLGVLSAVARGGNAKKGGAGVVVQDTSEGLHIAGWCNELPLDARGDTVAKGADLGSGLQLTLLLVNSGTGRRGGVRVVAPSSARWLRAEASYAYNIGLPPHDDKTRRPLLRLQRSTDSSNGDGHRLSGGPGQLEVLDSAPLPKYGVRVYTVIAGGYLPGKSDGQNNGDCNGWLLHAAAERAEHQAAVGALKSEL